MKKAFTLIELLVVIALLVIFASLTLKGCGFGSGYSQTDVFDAEVLRKYEVHQGNGTIFRVDVRKSNTTFVETLNNIDDVFQGKHNSATLHSNLLETNWYRFETRGVRNERWSNFPNIMNATKIDNPNVAKGEIDY